MVVIADIVNSRGVTDRANLQNRLRKALQEVNSSSQSIHSPCTITLGDEFQALYGDAAGLFADLWHIKRGIHPEVMRVSLSLGRIDTSIVTDSSLGMDGPAFHAARDNLVQMKKDSGLITIAGISEKLSGLVNGSIRLLFSNAGSWNTNRLGIQEKLLKNDSISEISDSLGISKSAVYQNIKQASLNITTTIQHEIERLLSEELQHD